MQVERVDHDRVVLSDDTDGIVGELVFALLDDDARMRHLLLGAQSELAIASLRAERIREDELRWKIARGASSVTLAAAEIERLVDIAYEVRRMQRMEQFPIGATLDGGRYTLTEHLFGGPDRGLYRGRERVTDARVLVTMGPPQADVDARRRELAWIANGVARIRTICPLDGNTDYTLLVEDEPAGAPVRSAEPARSAKLGAAVARIAQASGPFGGLRPELVYVDDAVTVAPRCERFLATAAQRGYGVAPVFPSIYLAPEFLAGEPISAASDVFSLGAILAQWVTGEHAFEGEGAEQAVSLATSRRRAWRGPRILGTLVDECLRPSATERPSFAYVIEVLDGLAEQPERVA